MHGEHDGAYIYENDIPAFVGQELERLYESIYCTLDRLHIYGEDVGASTYVARREGAISTVILFRRCGSCLHVLNHQAHIPPSELKMFLSEIFRRYETVRSIRFNAMESNFGDIGYATATFPAVEENIIYLPSTPDDFMSSLGMNTRKNLRSAERKLLKNFPSFRYITHIGAEVEDVVFREIFSLSDQRMEVKQKDSYINSVAAEYVIRLVRLHGYVGLATVDGRICGGNIWYRVGNRYFMHIIAHDRRFDSYMLGNLQMYWTFCDCITRGGRECWLMGGGRQHKSRFLAQTRHLTTTIVFRSRLARLLDLPTVLTAAFISWRHVANEGLLRARQKQAVLSRQLSGIAAAMRVSGPLAVFRLRKLK